MFKKLILLLVYILILVSFTYGQFDNSVIYDFRDGSIIAAAASPDGKLTLSGNYSHHSDNYGLNMKVDGEINIDVDGSSTIRFLGSEYSSLNMIGTAIVEGDLGTHDTQVAGDLSDVFDFVYAGGATTLNFKLIPGSGNDLYLPTIEVIPSQSGGEAEIAESNIIYYYDFRDGSIIPTDTDGQSDIVQGLIEVIVGTSNAYGYNGAQHGAAINGGNQIKLQVSGNTKILIGGSIYSGGTITASSESGAFDITQQSSTTPGNYGNDGSTVDFIYVGDAGTITLDFDGTNYVPYIEMVPITYEVNLTPWVQKSGTITINEVEIGLTSGEDASSNAEVTISAGTVISATNEAASLQMDLGGNALSSYTPMLTGDIDSIKVDSNVMSVYYADPTSNPGTFTFYISDNSLEIEAEAGKTYTYNFYDGSEMPQTSYQSLRYETFVSSDGILTINSNTDEEAQQFGYHDATHGGVFFSGNSFDVIVAGNAIITFIVDTYGNATDAILEFKDSEGNVLGTIAGENIGDADGFASSFAYEGQKGVITATLLSADFPTAEIYMHGVNVENAAQIDPTNGKVDVWDFGAEQLDADEYNNQLTVEKINAWYDPTIEVGSTGNVLPAFTEGVLSWIGGGNDRLRSTNEALTRYDENISTAPGYTGRVYVNSAAATGRYMSLTLSKDDEVTIIAKTDAGGIINFEFVPDPEGQTDQVEIPSDLTQLDFVAKEDGTYHIFDSQGKASYYRILRKDATYMELTGTVDVSEATELTTDYSIIFTNQAGKIWSTSVTDGTYAVTLPVGYTYDLSLADANGYIISNGTSLEVDSETTSHDITIIKVGLYTVSGAILGIDTDLSNLELKYTPDPSSGKIFAPEPMLDLDVGTYSVELEPEVEYTISAEGVNDYEIPLNTITIDAKDTTVDVVFALKSLNSVTITAPGLNEEQLGKLSVTFTNLYEEGYDYSFASIMDINLRNGTYTITTDGLDEYPLELGLTSNLIVEDAAASKSLMFNPVTNWTFDDKVIDNDDIAYKGLLLKGQLSNEVDKGHLTGGAGDTILVPVNVGDKITVGYYYTADFTIAGGDTISTNSQSTNTLESADYVYDGDISDYVPIYIGDGTSTTYITNIAIDQAIDYTTTLTVGTDKDFQFINDALDAVSKMVRADDERVTIMIDPGDYEEMLVISLPNITLKNAALSPDIALLNNGVDISDNAVRVTSYYGHGYNYYSMKNNQKWDADILRVNKENGYLSYENRGSGSTNGSFWNATVVVSANGFNAEDIIFENSFNQYISQKESEDVVLMWDSGSRGERPTDYGNTAVQNRSFVERAAAISITNDVDKVVLNKCRVIGRQDSFYGGRGSRVVVYKGAMMGAVDYIFGAMTAVFYKTDLSMNTSDVGNDRAYITAAQHGGGRGFLMYECNVTTAIPGTETASTYRSKPGYYGRPWQATTSEVVFYNTNIETSNYTGEEGQSLILPLGWQNTLGGESSMMYEYGTVEESGADNLGSRASWSTILDATQLSDGTDITPYEFTKGNDGWDPLPGLIENETVSIPYNQPVTAVDVYAYGRKIFVKNVVSKTQIQIYNIEGRLMKSFSTSTDMDFNFIEGLWVVLIEAEDGQKAVKIITR